MVEEDKKPEKKDLEELIEIKDDKKFIEELNELSRDGLIEVVSALKDNRNSVLFESLEEIEDVKKVRIKQDNEKVINYSQPRMDEENEDKYSELKKQEQFYQRTKVIENPLTRGDSDERITRINEEYETNESPRYRSASEIAEEGRDILGEQAKKYDIRR